MTAGRRLALLVLLLVSLPAAGQSAGDSDRERSRASRRTPVVDVFERSRGAVVNISSTEIVTVRSPFGFERLFEDLFDMPARPRARQYKRESVGSGFVIHPDGYLVTNAHVVARTAERRAVFADGGEFDARIVAYDLDRDLAVLKIDADAALPTLPLGRSDDLMVGETVIAIGNPLGYQHTVTAGVVSAVDRDLDVPGSTALQNLIQTDASINPGNSGGPLLNVNGELIGINTAIRGDAQNIGFAIPVDQLREVLPDLLDVHRRYRIESGLAVSNLDGPRVVEVRPDSPAEEAGIRPGDVLVQVDGRPVRQGVDYDITLIGRQPGDRLRLKLLRDGRPMERSIVLVARPAPDGAQLAREKLGLELYPLPEEIARDLRLPGGSGLLVMAVEPEGPAARAGVERRDVLLSLGRHHLAGLDDLSRLLELVDAGDEIPVAVLRVERGAKARLSGVVKAR